MTLPDEDPSFTALFELIILHAGGMSELAAATGVPRGTLRKWRNGDYPGVRRTEHLDRVNAWAKREILNYPPTGYPNGLIGIERAGPPAQPIETVPAARSAGSEDVADAPPSEPPSEPLSEPLSEPAIPESSTTRQDAGRVPTAVSGYEPPTSPPSTPTVKSRPQPEPPAPPGIGRLGLFLGVAVLGTAIAILVGAALPPAPLTKPFPSTSQPSPPPPTTSAAAPPARDHYGCSGLTSLPATVDLSPQDLAPAAALMPSYDVNSAGTAVPFQLHPGGYMDQAFVATHESISALGTVPGIDFQVGPQSARLIYELWDLNGHQLGTTTAPVDASNSNLLVVEPLKPQATVQPGHVYFFRVINPDAAPAVGMYIRSPEDQHLAKPFPVCLVDAEPPASPQARLSIQGDVLSGQIATNH